MTPRCGPFLFLLSPSGVSCLPLTSLTTSLRQYTIGGDILILAGTIIHDCATLATGEGEGYGGMAFVGGGSVLIRDSSVNISSAVTGGFVTLRSGKLELERSTIARGRASSIGSMVHIPPTTVGEGPLFLVTFTSFLLDDCEGSIFHREGNAQLVVRRINAVPLPGCNQYNLAL